MRTQFLMVLLIAAMLAGCTSHPVEPVLPHASRPVEPVPSQVSYWDNPQWINDLEMTINSNIVYPLDFGKSDHKSAVAVVQFTYDKGRLNNVRIVKSTGNQIIDSAIVTELENLTPPLAEGQNTNIPRTFQFPITLQDPASQFFQSILGAIYSQQYYPRSAILHGDQGWVTMNFQYRNGKLLNPSVFKSSGSRVFERAAFSILSSAKMPKPPSWEGNKTLHFLVTLHWTLSSVSCTLVGYGYKHGKIAGVHVVHSSGFTEQDKTALLTVTRGNFPQPPADLRSTESSFLEPVCEN